MQTMCIAFIACSLAEIFIWSWMAHLGDDVLYVCLRVCWAHLIAFMFQMFQTSMAHRRFNFEKPAYFVEEGDSRT